MQATVLSHQTILDDGRHHGFPSLCQWRGRYYLACRTAMTHNILPPGYISVWDSDDVMDWEGRPEPDPLDQADLRDPKLIPSDDALFLMACAYVPHPALFPSRGLAMRSHENVYHTMLCYTTNGRTWSPWVPILRPGYWGWSVLALPKSWVVAAYHTGQPGESMQLWLWAGQSLLALEPAACLYDGASFECTRLPGTQRAFDYRYPHGSPCEPVLYQPAPGVLACCVRTESSMDIGVSVAQTGYQDWRWHTVPGKVLHPSSVVETDAGWLLAARCVEEGTTTRTGDHDAGLRLQADPWSTRLYQLCGQRVTEVLRLPSGGDCAYPSMVQGPEPGTVLVAYYSQGEHVEQERYRQTLPGAALCLATVGIEP